MKYGWLLFGLLLPLPLATAASGSGQPTPRMVKIAGGTFRPLYRQPGETMVTVAPFQIDVRPVTRAEYEAFVRSHPRWQRGRAPALFVDDAYLNDWAGPANAGEALARSLPVTDVSWFAAKSYCEAEGARLPTTNEWEYVARADEHARNAASSPFFLQRVLELTLARSVRPVGSGFRNAWGIYDLHGGAAEWVYDFASIFAGEDSRATTKLDRDMTCAAGATHTGTAGDYAAYLRYALRGTVNARTTTGILGFRCARSL